MDHLRRLLVIILEWASLALGVFVAQRWNLIVYDDLASLAAVVLTMGVLNSFVRPMVLGVFLIVSIPFLILTLGLAYYLVVFLANGTVLFLADQLLSSFEVKKWALATLCISMVSWLLTSSLGIEQVKPWRRPGKESKDDTIDV